MPQGWPASWGPSVRPPCCVSVWSRYCRRVVRIGVAKEIKTDEYRVALTPAGARELVQKGHDVLIETTAGDGSAMPDDDYVRAGAQIVSLDDVWQNVGAAPQGEGADRGRVSAAARRSRPLHVSAHRRRRAADARTRRQRRQGCCVRDGRDAGPAPPAARADERDRGQAGAAGGRVLPREAARRARRAARRRSRRGARPRARARRRRRWLQRGGHRHRSRRARDDPRQVDRPHALPRRDPLRTREHAHVLDAPDRVVDPRKRTSSSEPSSSRARARRSSSRAGCSAR